MSASTVTKKSAATAGPATAPHSLVAEFASADALVRACEQVRNAGYTRWDAHSPYPVHGIDRAIGIRATRLPVLIFLCGATGTTIGILLQWWTNAVNAGVEFPWVPTFLQGYNFIISGKPYWSFPANIPVIFELTILLSAFGAFFGMLALNGLPQHYNPLLRVDRFRRVTDDRFFISIAMDDPKYGSATRRLLEGAGAAAVEVADDVKESAPPRWFLRAHVILACFLLIPLAVIAYMRVDKQTQPRIHIVQDMDNQERYTAGKQMANPVFADGRSARPKVAGTLAREDFTQDPHYFQGRIGDQWAVGIPMYHPELQKLAGGAAEVNEQLMRRGRDRYAIFCSHCHGLDGAGVGRVATYTTEREIGFVPPKSYVDPDVLVRPVGHLFNTITNGIRTMAPHGDQIPVADRWAIVAYVKALQRAQTATLEDVPTDERSRMTQPK
ncbi:MAG: DUF3341 domain-containing protein [Phycisphaerales bacterium]|nr:DUF3341 domain-containing protein [Phycisphaerales bacterium]